MPTVAFTQFLQRFADCSTARATGSTVGEALEDVFRQRPTLRGYVLDDQGAPRKHVAIFIDGQAIRDRQGMSDAVAPESEIFVMQALSGG